MLLRTYLHKYVLEYNTLDNDLKTNGSNGRREEGEGKNYARGFLVLTSDRLGILLSDHQGLKDSRSLFMWVRACVHERTSLSLSHSHSHTHTRTHAYSLSLTNTLTHTSVYNTALQRKRERENLVEEKREREAKQVKMQHSRQVWNSSSSSRALQYSFWWERGRNRKMKEMGESESKRMVDLLAGNTRMEGSMKTETGVLLCFQSYISITFSLSTFREREREMD